MNAPTFDAHSPTCPVCHRSNLVKSGKLLTGLLVCQHCRERLVISWSGHYVRDPFHLRQLGIERSLRRDSHPFYRILRDLRFTPPHMLVAILAGTLLVGLVSVVAEQLGPKHSPASQSNSLIQDQTP